MQVNISLDTSQPNDLAHLATLSAALSGGSAPTPAAPKPSKANTAKEESKPESKAESSTTTDTGTGARITIEDLRSAAKNKRSTAVQPLLKSVGKSDTLGAVPEENRQALLDAINALADK